MEDNNNFDPMEEMKQIKKNLRRRNVKLIAISVILVLALMVGIFQVAIPAVESLYWEPYDSTIEQATDLQLTLQAYTELFLPGWEFTSVASGRTGFAEYDLVIRRFHLGRKEYDYQEGSLRKNDLGWSAGFTQDWMALGEFDRMRDVVWYIDDEAQAKNLKMLESMPEYISLQVAVSFDGDLDMAQILQIHDETDCTIAWVAIRHCNPQGGSGLYCGMSPFTAPSTIHEINDAYPQFYLDPMLNPEMDYRVEILEQHFRSLLAYSADQLDAGRGAQIHHGTDRNYYREVLDYVEENGIKSYGVVVFGTPQQLLELLENEQVTQIKIMDAWIDVT